MRRKGRVFLYVEAKERSRVFAGVLRSLDREKGSWCSKGEIMMLRLQ